MLAASNIPLKAGRLNSQLLRRPGMADLREYVSSGMLQRDVTEGIGLNMWGRADDRSDAIMLIAKMCTLGGPSTYMVTLHQLVQIVQARSDKLRTVENVDYLFVDWFERRFANTTERPYSFYELVSVEEFLLQRKNYGKATYFGGNCVWDQHKWWSQEFLVAMSDCVVNMKVGR